jgi:plastocyanin
VSIAVVALGLSVPSSVVAQDAAVAIVDRAFQPAEVTVSQGSAVIWSNGGQLEHTVTEDGGAFDSGGLAPGEAFGHVFEAAGRFAYRCTIHAEMTGVVVVTAVAATPTPSDPTPLPGTLPPGFGSPSPQPGTDQGLGLLGAGGLAVLAGLLIVAVALGFQVFASRSRGRGR